MILSDVDIRHALNAGDVKIQPEPNDAEIQPGSVDLNLGSTALVWRVATPHSVSYPHGFYIDPSKNSEQMMDRLLIPPYIKEPKLNELFLLGPQQFMLTSVKQHIWVPRDITAFLHGRSSLARYGLFVHITAGLLDAGWDGCATLELYNASPYAVRLWSGMSIATVTFHQMVNRSIRPYGHDSRRSKYQGDSTVVISRYHSEIEADLKKLEIAGSNGS